VPRSEPALAGAVLISTLTSSFFTNLQNNPDVPKSVVSTAQVELTSGVPFVSDKDLRAALDKANVSPSVTDAVVDENADARIGGLRTALTVLGLMSAIAFVAARRLPRVQPGDPRFGRGSRLQYPGGGGVGQPSPTGIDLRRAPDGTRPTIRSAADAK